MLGEEKWQDSCSIYMIYWSLFLYHLVCIKLQVIEYSSHLSNETIKLSHITRNWKVGSSRLDLLTWNSFFFLFYHLPMWMFSPMVVIPWLQECCYGTWHNGYIQGRKKREGEIPVSSFLTFAPRKQKLSQKLPPEDFYLLARTVSHGYH